MNYLLVLRNQDIPSELINFGSKHAVVEVRAWISALPGRWVEVECLCGALSRKEGPQTYLDLALGAWSALCGSTEPVSA